MDGLGRFEGDDASDDGIEPLELEIILATVGGSATVRLLVLE